jgi:hypothetical protein
MAWLGSGLWLFERTCGWARDSGFSRGHASAARIFAAPLVHSMKRLRCCVTPRAIGTAASHGITNLIRTSDAAHSSAFETAPNGIVFALNAGSMRARIISKTIHHAKSQNICVNHLKSTFFKILKINRI